MKKKIIITLLALFFMFPSVAFADTLNGMDISSWESDLNPYAVDADFIGVKVSQGFGYTNPTWSTQAQETLDSGKLLLLYHYASGGNAIAEADHFVNECGSYAGKAIFALDWESYQNSNYGCDCTQTWIATFNQEVYDRTGQRCLVYASRSVAYGLGVDNSRLWVAQYATTNTQYGYDSDPWRSSLDISQGIPLRQYSSTGIINGYDGYLDLDVFYGNVSDWYALANGSPSNDNGEQAPTYSYDIRVDGDIGYNTTTAWQQQLDTGSVDGEIWGQCRTDRRHCPAISSYNNNLYSGGSWMVGRIQQFLIDHGYFVGNTGVDYNMGYYTVCAIQGYLIDQGYFVGNTRVDGSLGYYTACALQESINANLWSA